MVSLTIVSPEFGLILASHFRKKHNYMKKFPAISLLATFLVISMAGFSQNSKPLPTAGKDPVKEIASLPTQGEKVKQPGDSTRPNTNQHPSDSGNISRTDKIRHAAMSKKELRKHVQRLPDTSEFIYDVNAFYSLGK